MEDFQTFYEAIKYKHIQFWDVDQTIFDTFAEIIVRDKSTGKELHRLSNAEYNSYVLADDEEFDFSEFRDGDIFQGSKPIKSTITRLKKEYNNKDTMIVFLTARQSFTTGGGNKAFRNKFNELGIKLTGGRVRFELSGDLKRGNNTQKKEYIINRYMGLFEPSEVTIWDDHLANVNIADSMAKKYPNTKFNKMLISNGKIVNKGSLN